MIFFHWTFFRFGIFNPSVVYDHLGEIFSALIFGSFVFCVFLYIKVRIELWWTTIFAINRTSVSVYMSITNHLCIQGSNCTIFHRFWFIWEHNNWFLLGKYLQISMIFLLFLCNNLNSWLCSMGYAYLSARASIQWTMFTFFIFLSKFVQHIFSAFLWLFF